MRVFMFANQGHGTTAIKAARNAGASIVGVCSAPDRPWWRKLASRFRHRPFRDPFDRFEHPKTIPGLRLFASKDLDAVRKYVAECKPDMILSCSFHRLIPVDVFGQVSRAYNVHAGLLPARGGGTPNRWAIREGDPKTGVTAHVLAKGFDEGDIVWQEAIDIGADENWGEVEARLEPLVANAVSFLVGGGAEGQKIQPIRQTPHLQKSYRGEDYSGQAPDQCRRICRATLPKFCGLRLSDCRSRSADQRPCGIDIWR